MAEGDEDRLPILVSKAAVNVDVELTLIFIHRLKKVYVGFLRQQYGIFVLASIAHYVPLNHIELYTICCILSCAIYRETERDAPIFRINLELRNFRLRRS